MRSHARVAMLMAGCGAGVPLAPSSLQLDHYAVELRMAPSPPTAADPASLTLEVFLADEPVADADVQVLPWMPEHNHGTGADPLVTADGRGGYLATWEWAMAGYWELDLEVAGGAGVDTAVVGYDVE